ncbi:putative HTH-type transcriptional regulator YtcD [compost metagenome]
MANFNEDVACPMTATLEYIGGRWKCVILFYLTTGTRRFGEIGARIPAISRKVLTQQLKEMERDGLITRKQYNEIPPKVEYSLTELGKSLTPVFQAISSWGKTHVLKM